MQRFKKRRRKKENRFENKTLKQGTGKLVKKKKRVIIPLSADC